MKNHILDELQHEEDLNSIPVVKLIGLGVFIWLAIQEFSDLLIWILRTMLLEIGIEPHSYGGRYNIMLIAYFLVMIITTFIVVQRIPKMQLTHSQVIQRSFREVVIVFFVLAFFTFAKGIYEDIIYNTPDVFNKKISDAIYTFIPYIFIAIIFWKSK